MSFKDTTTTRHRPRGHLVLRGRDRAKGFAGFGMGRKLLSAGGRQLLFLRRHLPPQDLQVIGNAGIIRLLM